MVLHPEKTAAVGGRWKLLEISMPFNKENFFMLWIGTTRNFVADDDDAEVPLLLSSQRNLYDGNEWMLTEWPFCSNFRLIKFDQKARKNVCLPFKRIKQGEHGMDKMLVEFSLSWTNLTIPNITTITTISKAILWQGSVTFLPRSIFSRSSAIWTIQRFLGETSYPSLIEKGWLICHLTSWKFGLFGVQLTNKAMFSLAHIPWWETLVSQYAKKKKERKKNLLILL